MEHPYRPMPKDDQEFDPERHGKTVHKKGPLKGKETWVRKSAIESDKEAQIIAEKREGVIKKRHSWLGNTFRKKEKYTDVLTEEALIKHLGNLNLEWGRWPEAKNLEALKLHGHFNGHELKIFYNSFFNGELRNVNGFVDDREIKNEDLLIKIIQKIDPMLRQRYANFKKTKQIGISAQPDFSDDERAALEVLGKLPPKKAPELEQADEQKQLGPKTEE